MTDTDLATDPAAHVSHRYTEYCVQFETTTGHWMFAVNERRGRMPEGGWRHHVTVMACDVDWAVREATRRGATNIVALKRQVTVLKREWEAA